MKQTSIIVTLPTPSPSFPSFYLMLVTNTQPGGPASPLEVGEKEMSWVSGTHFPPADTSLLGTFHLEVELRPAVRPQLSSPADTCSGQRWGHRGNKQEEVKSQSLSLTLLYPVPRPQGHTSLTSVYSRARRVASARLSQLRGSQREPVHCRHGPCCQRHPGDAAAQYDSYSSSIWAEEWGGRGEAETHCWVAPQGLPQGLPHRPILPVTPGPHPGCKHTGMPH